MALDIIDKRILFELDKNARIPETKLAKLVKKIPKKKLKNLRLLIKLAPR